MNKSTIEYALEIQCLECKYTGSIPILYIKNKTIKCSKCGKVFLTSEIVVDIMLQSILEIQNMMNTIEAIIMSVSGEEDKNTLHECRLIILSHIEKINAITLMKKFKIIESQGIIQKLTNQIEVLKDNIEELETLNEEWAEEYEKIREISTDKDVKQF